MSDISVDSDELADKIADRIAERLLTNPNLLEAVATQLAARMTDTTTQPATSSAFPASFPNDPRTPLDTSHESAAADLAACVSRKRPDLIDGDPMVWARSMVVAGGVSVSDVFVWALSPDCPTPVWREMTTPVPGPRIGKRARKGTFTQMRAEYKASQSVPDAAAQVDRVVDGIGSQIVRITGLPSQQLMPRARESALELLRAYNFDADKITTVVEWGMTHRSHWRSNVTGVPAKSTFKKIHGDWVSAGKEHTPIAPELADSVEHLERGWRHYYAQRINSGAVEFTATTRTNLVACLTGGDGADPIEVVELEKLIKWLCDRSNRHGAFLLNGSADFPRIQNVRRGLIAMTSQPTTRVSHVAQTNTAAAAGISYGTAVEEV